MNPRRAVLALLVVATGLLAPRAWAETPEQEKEQVEGQIAELAALIDAQEGRRTQLQSDISATEARMKMIRDKLTVTRNRIAAVEADIEAQSAESSRLQTHIDELQRSLALTRLNIRDARFLLQGQAVELYVHAATNVPQLVFGLDELAELVVGISYAESVVAETGTVMRLFEILKSQEEGQQGELSRQQSIAQEHLARLKVRYDTLAVENATIEELEAELAAELEYQRALLRRTQTQIDEFESEKSLAEEELAALEREIRARSSGSSASPGRLSWPIDSSVSSGFGIRVHPILGTERLHAGIDLSAATGTPVQAAGAGTVILAGLYGGYGYTVVIDHGGGLSTLYAHLSSVAVSFGEAVEGRDVIGRVGSTGFSTGPHLHFETREHGTPVDPMRYMP